MPIQFSCPACGRPYRVKDELAGKTAKCGKCQNRMQIPGPAAAAPVAAAPARAAAPAKADLASWMDEELAAAPPVKPTPPPSPAHVTCPKCGASQPAGATLCGSCGKDLPAGAGRTAAALKPVPLTSAAAGKKKSKRRVRFEFKLGSVGTLIRGTMLSILFATIGAVLWAVIAVLTMRESIFIAWAMGGLAGFGMALGHDDDDGTTAGIIAAFVSLFGIIVAKILIVVFVVAALLAAAVGAAADAAKEIDPLELDRSILASRMAQETLDAQGVRMDNVDGEGWRTAVNNHRTEVDKMSPEEVKRRLAEYDEKMENEMAKAAEAEAAAAAAAPAAQAEMLVEDEEPEDDEADVEQAAVDGFDNEMEEEMPGFISLFFQSMFRPLDGLFMLFAFFTAYKIGSGKPTD